MPLHPAIDRVTDRIRRRSRQTRETYLAMIGRAAQDGPARAHLSCGNQAHAYAAMGQDKDHLATSRAPNIGIVTAYNDMLSPISPMKAIRRRSSRWRAGWGPRRRWRAGFRQCATGSPRARTEWTCR